MSEYSHRRDFLFCKICGTMMDFKSTKYAKCPLCYWKTSMKEIAERDISYTVTAEDIRRELNIEQFVNPDGMYLEERVVVTETFVFHKCSTCGENKASFTSQQMRGADEGETKIYSCTRCGKMEQEN